MPVNKMKAPEFVASGGLPEGEAKRGVGKRGPGKRTLERAKVLQEARVKMQLLMGPKGFKGDGVEFLQYVYSADDIPLQIRMDAAARAAPFERPKLSSIEHSGNVRMTHEAALKELQKNLAGDELPAPDDTNVIEGTAKTIQ